MPEKPWLEVHLDENSDSVRYAGDAYSDAVTNCMEVTMQTDSFLNECIGRQMETYNDEQRRDSLLTCDLLNLHIRQYLILIGLRISASNILNGPDVIR